VAGDAAAAVFPDFCSAAAVARGLTMNIVHVIAGLPQAGGMSELVPLLALEQVRLGHAVTIVTVGEVPADTVRRAESGGVRLIACPDNGPHRFYYSRMMRRQLPAIMAAADVVHVHGCWTFPVWWGCHAALKCHTPFVRSPHGSLAPERLRISRWKKMAAGLFFDRRHFERAAVIHATAESEAREVLSYLSGNAEVLKCESSEVLKLSEKAAPPVVVIPNGVDAGAFDAKPDRAGLERLWPACKGKRVVLFLSRLHPIKGADLLVEAWGRLESSKVLKCESSQVRESASGQSAVAVGSPYAQDSHQYNFKTLELPNFRTSPVREGEEPNFRTLELPNFRTSPWHLLIAGPDEQGTLKRLSEQVRRLGLEGSVTFCGPLYGEERSTLMAGADLFVLPTRNENFGLVVAEALACGVPVITTKGAPWQELLGSPASSKVLKCESCKGGETDGGQSAVAVGSQQSKEAHHVNFRTLELSNFRTSPNRCGWWVDIGVEPLAEALREAMALTDEERHALGENGRRLVKAKYRWPMIAKAMEKVYEGCVRSSKVREF
jgi:glycosyltransferase involved in cell wall biosynthesis